MIIFEISNIIKLIVCELLNIISNHRQLKYFWSTNQRESGNIFEEL